ncbi:MAG: VanZ family protein [Clostridia bacterium]|nr:VanZ family protein [Clostridia bacterium]
MKKKTTWIVPAVFALLVLVIMILIYYFSSENGLQSTATSNGVTRWVVKIIRPDFDSMEKSEKAAYFSQVAHYVRKAAHFTEYFLLGLFSSLLVVSVLEVFGKKNVLFFLIPLGFSFLYAVFDEYHQRFVGGRAAQFTDVLIDTAGAFFATVIVVLFFYFAKKRKK